MTKANAKSNSNVEQRVALKGCVLGMFLGGCFGGLLAWWFNVQTVGIFGIMIFHAAFAGVAMGAWVLPTLYDSEPS